MAIHHCICNYVPGIAKVAEMADIAGLIAPRPLLIESGIGDPIFPHGSALKAFGRLEQIYNNFSAEDGLALQAFEGGHRWNGGGAFDWLEKWM